MLAALLLEWPGGLVPEVQEANGIDRIFLIEEIAVISFREGGLLPVDSIHSIEMSTHFSGSHPVVGGVLGELVAFLRHFTADGDVDGNLGLIIDDFHALLDS